VIRTKLSYSIMKTIYIYFRYFLIAFISIFLLIGCEPVVDPGDNGEDPNVVLKEYGTLEVEFRVPGSFLPPNRVLRADLSIAKSAELLYKGEFCYVANVYNTTLIYKIKLEPGQYYYQAGIVCIAEGDSCSAAGFPGGKYGMKWTMGKADVKANESIHVVPQFTQ
jgi:hypothetical protein